MSAVCATQTDGLHSSPQVNQKPSNPVHLQHLIATTAPRYCIQRHSAFPLLAKVNRKRPNRFTCNTTRRQQPHSTTHRRIQHSTSPRRCTQTRENGSLATTTPAHTHFIMRNFSLQEESSRKDTQKHLVYKHLKKRLLLDPGKMTVK